MHRPRLDVAFVLLCLVAGTAAGDTSRAPTARPARVLFQAARQEAALARLVTKDTSGALARAWHRPEGSPRGLWARGLASAAVPVTTGVLSDLVWTFGGPQGLGTAAGASLSWTMLGATRQLVQVVRAHRYRATLTLALRLERQGALELPALLHEPFVISGHVVTPRATTALWQTR